MRFSLLLLLIPLLAISCAESSSSQASQQDATASLSPEQKEVYLSQGKSIAQATFGVLSSNLISAMKRGGPAEAVDYCNVQAYPLTDSMTTALHASIKRTAIRYRNPANAPTAAEQRAMETFLAQMGAGRKPTPVVEPLGRDSVAFYAPILLMDACQACHGELGEKLSPDTYALIQERYPDDKAIGFKTGELRGAWSIRFAREQGM